MFNALLINNNNNNKNSKYGEKYGDNHEGNDGNYKNNGHKFE